MKISTTYLLAIYFIWGFISLCIPAASGLWAFHVPLVIIAILFLIFEDKKTRRVIGALLALVAVIILIVDFRQEMTLKEKRWNVLIRAAGK